MVDKPEDFCPYVGLAPFESGHAEYYFGRSLDAATLADNVIASPLTVLFGPSGIGKTSLINVGLPWAIEQLGRSVDIFSFRNWQGDDFLVSMENEISSAGTTDLLSHHDTPHLSDSLQRRVNHTKKPVVLVLDQFEEYFVYERSPRVTAGLENELAKIILDEKLRASVLISIREDRFHLLDRLRVNIPDILDNTLELGHFTDKAVREAIHGPITVYNERRRQNSSPIEINEDFTDLLISQLKENRTGAGCATRKSDKERSIELPYLQLALEKIWDAAGGAKAIIFDKPLLEKHPVYQIVRDHLDKVIDYLGEIDKQICANIFDHLVTRSGTKFAMTAYDLSAYVDTADNNENNEETVARVLSRLAEKEVRIVKTVPMSGDKLAFEIFHDVLGPPLLAWRMRYRDEQRAKAELVELAWKEKQAQENATAARAQAQSYKRATFIIGLVLIIAVFAFFVAGWEWWQAETNARQATVGLLWNDISSNWQEDMNSAEVNAVWKLAADDELLRSEFINQLNRDSNSLRRLGTRANPIARAIGLKWPGKAVEAAQRGLKNFTTNELARADTMRNWNLIAFARGLSAFSDQLDAGTRAEGLRIIEKELKQFTTQSNTTSFDLMFAATSLTVLDKQLSPPIFDATKEQLRKAIPKQVQTNAALGQKAVATAIQLIALDLTQEEVSNAVSYLSRSMENPDTLSQQTIARSINAVASQVDQKKIPDIIANLVKSLSSINADSTNLPARLPILQAIEGLASAWRPEKHDPSSIKSVKDAVDKAFQNISNESDKALIARAAIPIIRHFPLEDARSSIIELIKFAFPTVDDTTAERIAATIIPATTITDNTTLSENDISVLITALEGKDIPQTKDPPDQTISVPENLIGARSRFLALVAPYYTVEQVKKTLPMMVKVCEKTNDPVAREALAEALTAFAPKMDAKMREDALLFAKYRLAQSGFIDEAAAWAEVIATFLESQKDDRIYVAAIVEVLKYPTSAGRPTKVFLDHFYSRFKDQELSDLSDRPWRAVAWIETRFPEIKLNTPPTPPKYR